MMKCTETSVNQWELVYLNKKYIKGTPDRSLEF